MTPRSFDDFAEFIAASYGPVLSAFADSHLYATIEAGATGHYLLIARDEALPEVGAPRTVEVTSGGLPLPDNPSDVDSWVLSTPDGQRTVLPRTASILDLVTATERLLHTR